MKRRNFTDGSAHFGNKTRTPCASGLKFLKQAPRKLRAPEGVGALVFSQHSNATKNDVPNWNCSLSINLMDAGAQRCRAISRRHPTPFSKSGNTIEPYFLHGGMGRIFIITSVITPIVPEIQRKKFTTSLVLSYVQTERKRTRKQQFSLMFVAYSLIFFAFAPTFAWCE